MSPLRVALAATFLVLVAACSSAPPTPTPFSLDRTSWVAVSVDGVPPAAGHAITLAFEGNRVSGTTGCNSWGGELWSDRTASMSSRAR